MDQSITVLAAAFNGSKYIEAQMDSILAQSQGGILLVVSDDCSTDGTGEIIDRYEEIHGNQVIALHRNFRSGGAAAHFLGIMKLMADLAKGCGRDALEESGSFEGQSSPRRERAYSLENQSLKRLEKAAHADYFMLSDQDDVWLPEKTGMLLDKMGELEREKGIGIHESAVLVHSDCMVVDQDLNEISPSFYQYQNISPERNRLSQLLVQNNVTGGSVMINRATLPYLEHLPGECLMHDSWLALVVCCFGRIGWVDRPLYLYRQHRDNTLGAKRGGSLKEVGERLKDGGPAKRNYRLMFAQAGSLLELFYDELTEDQRETLAAFSGLPERSRLGKIAIILRYGFTKNTFLGTLGQMAGMGD